MEMTGVMRNGKEIAVAYSAKPVMIDARTALDFFMSAQYQHSHAIVINKEAFSDDFFDLKTGVAGEILQKCVMYRIKLAIYGDFSVYTSKALQDFIRESNRGKDIFFLPSKEEAVERLAAV